MNHKPTIGTVAALIAFAAIVIPLHAAGTKPWYTDKLEKLGFYVFEKPLVVQDFKLETIAGGFQSRSAAKGNIVLLNFWATWCPPCKEEMPSIQALGSAMKGKKFEIMAVNLGDAKPTVQSFLNENKYSFPVYLDQKNSLSAAYASQGIPTTYVLDKSGLIIAGRVGGMDYSRPELIALFAEMAER